MARGYESLHPQQRRVLDQIGIPSSQVTQGWGYARASAGYHEPEGSFGGKPFSSCFDLSIAAAQRETLNRLVQAAVCPFVRTEASGWRGSEHVHCVTVGLRDGRGKVTILPGPRSQVKDFIAGRNGLVGHAPLRGPWVPSLEQRQKIRQHYEAWAPDLATGVWRGEERIPCYAWYEFGKVRCDVRRLCEALGGYCTWDPPSPGLLRASGVARAFDEYGSELHLASGRLEGDYYRAEVREIGEKFGYEVSFTALDHGTACRVDLRK